MMQVGKQEEDKQKLKAIRGMPDVLPQDVPLWHNFEECWHQLAHSYGYKEIRLPILEATPLFKRSIGEVTDIVEKEMFTFQDKDGDSITLRPEGTAGCVRACVEHNLLRHQIQRLWYTGPMFRYERPQKGRYRQFYHVGVETLGLEGPDIEVEHILMTNRFWRALQVDMGVSLQVNSLGSNESRIKYREKLIDYFSKYLQDLDADSQRRLNTNPLRILDSKNPDMAKLILDAPKCYDSLDKISKEHFELFLQKLDALNVSYEINPTLVRGLDYYNKTVYEWVTDKLGAQGTVCAGGRYDGLVEQLGGESTPAVGFAMGVERVLLLQRALGYNKEESIDAYLIAVGSEPERQAFLFAEELRNSCPKLKLTVHCGGGNFKEQFKKADKSEAKIALILGETELASHQVGVKFLREGREQVFIDRDKMGQFLIEYFE